MASSSNAFRYSKRLPIRVSNLRLGIDEGEVLLNKRLAAALRIQRGDIAGWRLLRKSLDARQADDFARWTTSPLPAPNRRTE